jgi:hypothetical protein
LPSPYLTGLLDEFFDGRLSPMLQTNRGCPFKCAFCHDGSELTNKVNQFSLERVKAEIDHIGERVPANIHTLHFSDLNFGMYKRDFDICAALAEVRKKRGFPAKVMSTTGKNSKERIIAALEQLEGAFGLTMSVQSMTPEVLENIGRDNIKLDQILELAPTIRQKRLPTHSEVILGLPGETKASHVDTLSQLLNAEIDNVVPYTLMMVEGSQLASRAQREKWGMQTKWRVIPRDFTRMSTGKTVVEVEEVVVATNTLTFQDYVSCRKIAFLLAIANNTGLRALLRFAIRNGLKVMDLVMRLLAAIDAAPPEGAGLDAPAKLVWLMREFERETSEELWDSEQAIHDFFADDAHFQELIEGKRGANLMQTYRAVAFAQCYDDLAAAAIHHAHAMFVEAGLGETVMERLAEVEKFCRGRGFNLFGSDRLETVPEAGLSYDFDAWVTCPDQRPLDEFRWPEPKTVRFVLTEQQYRQVEDGYARYGNTHLGRGKLLIRVGANAFWRRPVTG